VEGIMHYVTELWFDLKTEAKLKSAWGKLAARGITNKAR
jgi:hypothetical protein